MIHDHFIFESNNDLVPTRMYCNGPGLIQMISMRANACTELIITTKKTRKLCEAKCSSMIVPLLIPFDSFLILSLPNRDAIIYPTNRNNQRLLNTTVYTSDSSVMFIWNKWSETVFVIFNFL